MRKEDISRSCEEGGYKQVMWGGRIISRSCEEGGYKQVMHGGRI